MKLWVAHETELLDNATSQLARLQDLYRILNTRIFFDLRRTLLIQNDERAGFTLNDNFNV
nr:hypothetical protein [Defluviicoccus vanus]